MSTALTLAQIQAVKNMEQIQYEIGLARVREIFDFQDDEGKPIFMAKIEMGSTVVNIMGTQAEIEKLAPFKGKWATISGVLTTDLTKKGLKVTFAVSEVKEVK